MKKIILLVITIFSFVTFLGCKGSKKVDIYISVYPIEYIVKQIVKEDLVVESIYPRGAEVHDFEPTAKQIVSMSECQILFYIGLGLEPFITNGLDSTFKNLKTVELSNYLELVELDGGHSHNHDGEVKNEHKSNSDVYDQHVWLDPIAMIKMSNVVLEELLKIYPEKEETFTENAKDLVKELEELDQAYNDVVRDESISSLTIMVDHDAYAYWTYRYGINRIKLRSDNESNEVGTQEFLEKVKQAKEANIKYIISTKNEATSSLFGQYLKEVGATEKSLHHLGTITIQELKEGNNYISIMKDNLEVLKEVLPRKGEE